MYQHRSGRRSEPNEIRKSRAPRGRKDSAACHRRARENRSSEVAEDYVEVVADLLQEQGEARLVDIAERLGVTHVTATRTLTRLQRQGLIERQRYRSIFLTATGKRLALESRHRHTVVLEFLLALGVKESVAQHDAEGIEHHVSKETLTAFERHVKRIGRHRRGGRVRC